MNVRFEIIGLMSGTSMDGLDIAHVTLQLDDENGDVFQLLHSETVPIPEDLKNKIKTAPNASITEVTLLDHQLGHFYADAVEAFLKKFNISASSLDAIGCHGQTILHQPHNGFTLQVGSGNILAYRSGIKVVNDFRSHDICAGGQGAPLVPIGDFGLFRKDAEAFLNLGGFVNLSYKDKTGEIRAFDISPANLPLNKLAETKGMSYDKNGALAKSGEISFFLLDLLNSLAYYQQEAPKSLGTEWLESEFYPLIKFDKDIENNLSTITEHIAIQVSQELDKSGAQRVLVTGGGARNTYLIERIKHYFSGQLIIPEEALIDFKEAIVFAYLAALKLNGQPNSLASVTGAKRNMIGGVIHDPGY
jgi:anhydro-N-acetylmuramic acid kinase